MLTSKTLKIFLLVLTAIALASVVSANDNEWTFTTCGASGASGPSQSDCDSEYDDINVNVDSYGRQIWEAPYTGEYEITAFGAEGGSVDSPRGGRGASISGKFNLDEGDELLILVGQQGDSSRRSSSGRGYAAGGGGTFVTETNPSGESDIYVIAGGGGGSVHQSSTSSVADGNAGECGSDSVGSQTNSGGCGGSAGGDSSGSYSGFGGCGFSGSTGGCSRYLSGGSGSTSGYYGEEGGMGGGGAGGSSGTHARAAGAGGYSGGAGGRGSTGTSTGAASGGGGSYNNGVDQQNSAGSNRGHGYVVVDLGGPINSNPRPAEATGTGRVSETVDPELEIDLEHADGSQDIDVDFYDSDNNEFIGTDTVQSGETASTEWEDLEPGEHNWRVESCDENGLCAEDGSWTFEVDIEEPEITDFYFEDYQNNEKGYEHAFDTVVEIEFGWDNYDGECVFTFDNGAEEYEVESDLDESWGNDRQARCEEKVYDETHDEFDDSNGLFEGFQVTDEIDVDVEVSDEGIGETDASDSNHIPNQLPSIQFVSPEDGEFVTSDDIEIELEAHDLDDDEMTIYIYEGTASEQDQDNLLLKETVGDYELVNYDWSGLRVGGEYEWSVSISDTHENYTAEFVFTRLTSAGYRVDQQIDYEYNSIIVSQSNIQDIFFTVNNQIDSPQNLRTYLEGVDAEFTDTGESSRTYTLEEGGSREFQARIQTDDVGQKELIVTTEDLNLGVNTTESIPVYVREHPPIAIPEEVTGISLPQVLVVLLTSILFYSRSI